MHMNLPSWYNSQITDPRLNGRILRAPCEFETTPGRIRVHNLMNGLRPSVRDSSHRCAKRLDSKKKQNCPQKLVTYKCRGRADSWKILLKVSEAF